MASFRALSSSDFEQLEHFLHSLSPESKGRFGPHGYDFDSIRSFYLDSKNTGILGFSEERELIAYAILRSGFLDHDRQRIEGYGLSLNMDMDSTFAPAIADLWQGRGIGNELFNFVENLAKGKGIYRMILWGGVQSSNDRAVNYYKKLGFRPVGSFEYHGWNQDMIYQIPRYTIREILSDENEEYQWFFMKGLVDDEESFRITPADVAHKEFPTLDKPDSFTLGAFANNRLAGVVSFEREGRNREKLRHKGLLFRMLVSQSFRGMGIGHGLINGVVRRARKLDGLEQINLTVIANNPTAQRLYERAGFRVFSNEKNAVKWNGRYFDELTMARFL